MMAASVMTNGARPATTLTTAVIAAAERASGCCCVDTTDDVAAEFPRVFTDSTLPIPP